MLRYALKVIFLLVAVAQPVLAGGTLGSDELDVLLKQQPDVREFLNSTLKFSDSAYAEVRLGSHFKDIGGARVGPYIIAAKSLKDGRSLEVVLCTKARFLSRNGKELPESQMEKAAKVEETLVAVLLRQPQDERLECP